MPNPPPCQGSLASQSSRRRPRRLTIRIRQAGYESFIALRPGSPPGRAGDGLGTGWWARRIPAGVPLEHGKTQRGAALLRSGGRHDVDDEDEGVLSAYVGRIAGRTVAQAGRDDEQDPAADGDTSQALFPAGQDLAGTEHERLGEAAGP